MLKILFRGFVFGTLLFLLIMQFSERIENNVVNNIQPSQEIQELEQQLGEQLTSTFNSYK